MKSIVFSFFVSTIRGIVGGVRVNDLRFNIRHVYLCLISLYIYSAILC